MATRTKAGGEDATAQPAARKARGQGAGDDVLTALLSGLEEVLPGIEVIDRELVFENGGRADLAAVDPSGRLVLVLVAGDDGDRSVLEVLDTYHFARQNTAILARHLSGRRIQALTAPRIVVVNPANDATLVARLSALVGQGVEIFGVRSLKSAAGERSYLVQVGPSGAVEPSGEHGVEAFLRELPSGLREIGSRLAERMGRLDEELDAAADRNALVWRFHGDVLARVERVGSRLQASIAPHLDPVPLTRHEDVERVVEDSLARLVEAMGLSGATVSSPPPPATGRGERSPLDVVDSSEPLLTAEEIDAFRE